MLMRAMDAEAPRRSARTILVWSVLTTLGILLAPASGLEAASDVIEPCTSCTVGLHDRSMLAEFLREFDLVFEGVFLRSDSVAVGYERGRPLGTFRVDRIIRGAPASRRVRMMLPPTMWGEPPTLPGHLLVWVKQGCTIDAYPCGGILQIAPDRTMSYTSISTDW